MRKKRGKKILFFILLLLILGALGGVAVFASVTYNLPRPEEIINRQVVESTKIYDRTGEVLLYEIHGEEKRTIVPFEEIPDYIKQATISIEDSSFYSHNAFDWRGFVRAIIKDIIQGRPAQGGSTITQQLAKNAFLTPEKTIIRKLKELALAIKLEQFYSKDEILGLYLNQIPYGSNAYGIEAASQTYFDKPAEELSLAEAALLASIPKASSYYSPWGYHVDELLGRKDYVLKQMEELGYIDEEERLRAQEEDFDFEPQPTTGINAPHFVIYIQDYLNREYGEDFVEKGGLRVTTTLDWELQQIAEETVREGVARNSELYNGNNGSLVAQDPATGQILVMVGSADYFDIENEGNFNVAVQGLRQPGSAFKPFAYVTAFERGFTPDTVVYDVLTEFDTTGNPLRSYQPHNFDNKFRGPVTLREALARSLNIPAVKTLYLAGLNNTLQTATNFGINTLQDRSRFGLSLVLGGGEVTLLDLVGAYSVFAQDGIKHNRATILKIEDSKGNVLEEYKDNPTQVIDSQYTRLINDILSDVDLRSLLFRSSSLALTQVSGHQIALKTGTSNDFVDAWTVGYTPNLVVGVWAGNNRREPLEGEAGSIIAALPMWHSFTSKALRSRGPVTFTKPEAISTEKPILRAELDPQNIHSILYFVDRDDPQGEQPTNPQLNPQFTNWEDGIVNWLKSNIIDFSKFQGSGDSASQLVISINNPKNGDFITGGVSISANIISPQTITGVELYFNGELINISSGELTSPYNYQYSFTPTKTDLQNTLRLKARDSQGGEVTEEIILFK